LIRPWYRAVHYDGTNKGCPSLPTTAYVGGSVRAWDMDTLRGFVRRG
jgi:hypothetical protein